MPLQQIQLDQSIYNKQQPKWGAGRQPQRSPVSEALTPQQGGMTAEQRFAPNTVLDRMRAEEAKEAERKYNEKMMKMQHEQEMEKLKFASAAKEDAQNQQTTIAQVKEQAEQKGAQRQQIEDNPEEAAEAMYDLIKSMPDETQNVLLNQLFTSTAPSGTMSSAGKTVSMPEKYNPIAGVFLSKGWATIDKGGRPILSDPEREFEKTTFSIVEKGGKVYKLNTVTGEETELGATDEPEILTTKVILDVKKDAAAIAQKTGEKVEDVEHDIYVDLGVDDKTSQGLSKFNIRPKTDEDHTNWDKLKDFMSKVGSAITKALSPETERAKRVKTGEPAFNEANVNAITDVISDDVTEAERAHLKSQGATDADIDEAIRRKSDKLGKKTITTPTPAPAPLATSPSAFKGTSPSAFNK